MSEEAERARELELERLRAALRVLANYERLPLTDMAEPAQDQADALRGHIQTMCYIAREALGA